MLAPDPRSFDVQAAQTSSFSPRFSEASGLAYHEYGDPSSDQVVVFHHGWPSAGSQGALFDKPARERGVRILSPNRPGIGGSRMEEGRGFTHWPSRLNLFLEDLGVEERILVMGISGGGPYTLAACAAMPERVERGGVICGAGMVNGSMSDMVWLYRLMARLDRHAPWSLGMVLRVFRILMRLPGSGAGPGTRAAGLPRRDRLALADPELRDFISRGFVESMEGDVNGVLEDGRLYLKSWDFDPATIRTPVTFWHGREDRNIPPRMPELLAGTIAGSELQWYKEDGHFSLPLLRAEELLLNLVDGSERSTPLEDSPGNDSGLQESED